MVALLAGLVNRLNQRFILPVFRSHCWPWALCHAAGDRDEDPLARYASSSGLADETLHRGSIENRGCQQLLEAIILVLESPQLA